MGLIPSDRPRPSHISTLFDDIEVTKAIFPDELDSKAAAAHASADDENICIERHGEGQGDMKSST